MHLPANAAWLDDYLLELLAFPYGKHDDQVDSTSQFLKWASNHSMFNDIELNIISVGRGEYDDRFPQPVVLLLARRRDLLQNEPNCAAQT